MVAGMIIKNRSEDEFDAWLRKRAIVASEEMAKMGLPLAHPRDLLNSELGWLMILAKNQGKPISFDYYQSRFLAAVGHKKRSVLKARQVGFSWEIAAESLARCHLKDHHTSIFVSYNLDDAKEKISLVKLFHDELPLGFQKEIIIDSKHEVGFVSGKTKHNRRVTRVISYPSKAPRGKTGDVYLDELAHCQNDKIIYTGATALITRSGGQMTIGSTPLGKRGIFHAVHSQEFERYPGYWRQNVPWWLCKHFCKDVENAAQEAEYLTTINRIERFGSQALIEQYNALPLEDFQQEFELVFQDERVSFFPYELILPCMQHEKEEIPVYDSVERLASEAVNLGRLVAGFDVGRTNHPSELMIFEEKGDVHILRYMESMKNMPFPQQRERLTYIINTLREYLRKFRTDESGLGKQLCEELQAKFGSGLIQGITFTHPIKADLANSLKILFEEQAIVLPKSRDITNQLHSVKQKINESGNSIFDVEKNRHHHGDKMWAIAMGTYKPRRGRSGHPVAQVRFIGATFPKEQPISPDLQEVRQAPEDIALVPQDVLERRARAIAVSVRVWKRSGDLDTAMEFWKEHKKIRDEIKRRGSLAVAPVEQPPTPPIPDAVAFDVPD